MTTRAGRLAMARLRAAARGHPEWWALALAAVAWIAMVQHGLGRGGCCRAAFSATGELVAWTGMVVAMMVPTLTGGLRDMALRSYRLRRLRALGLYLAGYLSCWVLAGLPAVALLAWLGAGASKAAGVAFGAAAIWALVPARASMQSLCHRRIALRPVGVAADVDSVRQGIVSGAPCVAVCWPLMLACSLTAHALVVMTGCAILTVVEKRMFRPQALPIAAGAAGLASWSMLIAG